MRVWLVVGLVLVLGSWAVAQPAPTEAPSRLPALSLPLRLTPDAAASLAVQRSTDVALSLEQINAAQGLLRQVQAMRGLQVNGTASYTFTGPVQTIDFPTSGGGTETIQLSSPRTHHETLTAALPLYAGGRDVYAIRAARAGIDAAHENVQTSEVQVAFAARQAVYGVLRLQQLVVVAQQRLTAVAEHLRIAGAMFDAGTVARFEVVQAQTELARAKGDLIHARTAVQQQQAALLKVLNAAQGGEVVVEEGVPLKLPDGDLHALIAMALEERPEVAALDAAVRAREAALRLAEANDHFSLALKGDVNNGTASALASGLSWDVSLTLTKPFYQGGEKEAAVMQAQSALQTARLNVEAAQQGIALQVTQAQLNVDDAREALAVAEQGEVEARERVRIAQVRFGNGVSLGVEVLDAQSALAAAQTQVVNARYDLQVATTALRAALGLADLPKEPS